jgi:hypothetical protein
VILELAVHRKFEEDGYEGNKGRNIQFTIERLSSGPGLGIFITFDPPIHAP